MKHNYGILAQLPFILGVMFIFPAFGTMDRTDAPVIVDWTWYAWQSALGVAVIVQHFWFNKFQQSYEGDARGIVWLFYAATFALTIINISRFQ